MHTQLVKLENGQRWLTLSRTVHPQGLRQGGVAADMAAVLTAARGIDLAGAATPIGLGCGACHREGCPQRSAPPRDRALLISERERGMSALTFAGD